MTSAVSEPMRLAADFPQATEADWRKLVEGVLKGAPFEKLVNKTVDGLTIQPLYPRAANAAPVAARAPSAPWAVSQRVDHPDTLEASKQLLHDLENGATGFSLVMAGSVGARGFGLAAGDLAATLKGVYFDAGVLVDLDAGADSAAARTLADVVVKSGAKIPDCQIAFGLDPIGVAALNGNQPLLDALAKDVAALAKYGFKGHFVACDGRVIHDAGGSEAQELAFVLASGVAYLRALEAGGMSIESAVDAIVFRLTADADQFLTMAKFRALRKLWARVTESCGVTAKPALILAETSWRMLTQRDPSVNMLRATMATFAAGVAGANGLTVLPHTLALGLPDAFARRVARNTQLILLEESNLDKVADPAAGSGAIETLTIQLCDAAWTQFQEIERTGGIVAALEAGSVQKNVATVREARAKNIGRRKDVLTGASEFPNLHETVPGVLRARGTAPAPAANALAPIRLAAPFEALRDRSDAILAETGARPKVLLATLGTPADFTARATFAKSFFETGGIEAVEMDAGASDALKASGGQLVCLCSSDKVYAVQAEQAVKALHAAGAKHIYLAGKPGELEAPLRAAGLTDIIAAGGDALGTLTAAYEKLVTA